MVVRLSSFSLVINPTCFRPLSDSLNLLRRFLLCVYVPSTKASAIFILDSRGKVCALLPSVISRLQQSHSVTAQTPLAFEANSAMLTHFWFKTLISRNFRGDVPMDVISDFKSAVIDPDDVRA